MRINSAILIGAVLLCLPLFSCQGPGTGGNPTEETRDTIYPLGFLTDTLEAVEGTVGNGEYFTSLFSGLGLDSGKCLELCEACDSVFDVRKLRAGNKWCAYYSGDSTRRRLDYVVYENDRVNSTVFRCFDSLKVWKVAKPIEQRTLSADVTICSSLWNDMLKAGASPLLILKLSDIYAWTVDFFGLQEGDRFRAIYSQRECEGEVLSIDSVFYAVYTHGEKDYPVILFDQGDGGNIYWNEKGESMRKAFLKAPLHFSRISSGFSYHRRHPITKKVQPHLAVDYAAPKGTPVMAIGDGTVISAGYSGAAGNMVKIRHNSVYTSAYLHLSGYAKGIRAGERVSQGQVIGYVGSTGRSTGPHLDFRVWKNGSPINPLTMESPSVEPIRSENLPALDSLNRHYQQLLQKD